MSYVEPGGSWRPFWVVAGALGLFAVLDLVLPGPDVPPWLWALTVVTVLGAVGVGCLSARRVWTVAVEDGELSVGPEVVRLADVDAAHLAAVEGGVDAGAPVLGGGWTLPPGRSGLPLRLRDGRTVLVPTRDPAALRGALLAAVSDASDGRTGREGTLGS
ncbi:hypothetical protein JKP75_16810 [Blastococcus sp. TML/M2B]|uniref:hypothetical protein n=1 Tax=unclassified Blastococcus TaxID=2619396 RepID=UPI00190AF932|nr:MULTISPECIES: hypothetical protein [unclassified Blastococcus]MBN1094066.1 hypothetical protein [Blastococcus sp. TML/M2B]MBN1095812.1 hypothetical protein [Blastococcus sp. TML/C7B]